MRRIDILGLIFPIGFILAGTACMNRRLGRFGERSFNGPKPAGPDTTRAPSKETPEPSGPVGNLN